MNITTDKARLFWRQLLETKSFSNQVLFTMGTNLFLAAVALVTGPLAARLMGPTGRGELAAIQTWPIFLSLIAMLGLSDALVYFSARESERAGRYMTTAMIVGLFFAPLFILAGYLFMPFALKAQSAAVIAGARLYLLLIPIQIVVKMLADPLRGRNDLTVWNLLRTMPALCWLAVLLTGYIKGQGDPGWYAHSYLVALAFIAIPRLFVVKRRISGSFRPRRQYARPLMRYGLPLALSSVPVTLNLRLDQMLMAALLNPALLGQYVAAVAWSAAINPLINAVGFVLFPRIASQTSTVDQNKALIQGAHAGLLLTVVLGAPLLLLTPVAVPLLFGDDFSPAVPAAMILVVAAAVNGLKNILQNGLRGLGFPKMILWSEVAGLLLTGLALWLLLKPLGILGAAVASLFGYGTVTVALILAIWRSTGITLHELLIPTAAEVHMLADRLLHRTRIPGDF